MATDQQYADYVMEQLRRVPGASHRKMFGEYAVYAGRKVVALLCDNQFFLRPTQAGRTLLGSPTEGPPYPGAKPHFVMEGELEDAERMATIIAATAAALPAPKPKKPKKAKAPASKKAPAPRSKK